MEALFNVLIAAAVLLVLGVVGGVVFGASDSVKEKKPEEKVPEVQ